MIIPPIYLNEKEKNRLYIAAAAQLYAQALAADSDDLTSHHESAEAALIAAQELCEAQEGLELTYDLSRDKKERDLTVLLAHLPNEVAEAKREELLREIDKYNE